MPRTCTVCNHENRQAIEESLLAGESFRNIAKQFKASSTALFRHKTEHLPQALQKAHEAEEILRADSLLSYAQKLRERMERLHEQAEDILNQAKHAKDLRTALAAIREVANVNREARGNAILLGRLSGELEENANTAQVVIVLPQVIAKPADICEAECAIIGISQSGLRP
jgi:hypothetical protein